MYARYTTIEGYLSICYVCQSIATLRAQYKQRKRDKNHPLPIFAIGVRAYSSTAFFSIGYSGKEKKQNNTTDGEMSYGFRINSRPPDEGT